MINKLGKPDQHTPDSVFYVNKLKIVKWSPNFGPPIKL
jgi:hypothetical protein